MPLKNIKSEPESAKYQPVRKYVKTRVELHLHLEGAVRLSTIRELAAVKNHPLKDKSEKELVSATSVEQPSNLAHFLTKISLYIPLLVGDREAIERVAYELCQDQAAQHVAYFEVRFSPHGLANTVRHAFVERPVSNDSLKAVSPREVVKLVTKGLRRGENDFGVLARIILCSIKGQPGWATEVVQLASEFANEIVVGIDIAGDESAFTKEETEAFRKAKQLSIHRTVHAGESGPPGNVEYAVVQMHAERIGHGYRVLADQKVYQLCRTRSIHFETCPQSSLLTGAVKPGGQHPIATFASDGISFSISKDDPTVTKSTLDSEYNFLQQMGLNEADFVRANMNAARSSFLPDNEKQCLVERLVREFGLISQRHK